ncbi:exopolysaccharide biosynthesis polyprenyl glycosylphosphotransferase [soil metagenome]
MPRRLEAAAPSVTLNPTMAKVAPVDRERAAAVSEAPSGPRVEGASDGAEQHVPPPVVPGTEWFVRRIHGPLNAMWNRGFRFLFVLDAVALLALMFGINLLRFGTAGWPDNPPSIYVGGFAIATSIHLAVNYFFGLYEREPRLGHRPWLPRAFAAMVIGAGMQAVAFVVLNRYLMPRGNLVAFAFSGTVVLGLNRGLSRILAIRRQGPPKVILVGPAADARLAREHLGDSDRDAIVVGQVETPAELEAMVDSTQATDVLLLDVTAFGAVFPQPLNTLEDEDIGFLQRVSARETLLGLQSVRQVAGMPFVRLRSHAVPSYKLRLKRLVDLVLMIVFSPLWLLALAGLSLYVLARTGRPVLFAQTRVGYTGHEFRVVKFRTMTHDTELADARPSTNTDPRVMRGMQWMRDMRLDELPQLWNVIRGQMSLVGPRPERPELVAAIASRVPGYVLRHELPPGLTGLAQVYGRYSTDAEYKLGYDLQYMVNWSAVLDVQILVRTVWVVITRRV